MSSREGRHTAKISTWLLRFGFFTDLDKAVKAIHRGDVKYKGKIASTSYSVTRPQREDFEILMPR